MFFLLSGQNKKNAKVETAKDENHERVKNLFLAGKFPVVTTDKIEGNQVSKVLGLVCCRGYDSDEAFFGMASRAVNKGAHAIIGYCENVAFHPDGSRYFSCYGTAIMFEYDQDEKYGAAALRENHLRLNQRNTDSTPPAYDRPQRQVASDSGSASTQRPARLDITENSSSEPPRQNRLNSMNNMDNMDNMDQGLPPLKKDFKDDYDMPPMRPVGNMPTWHRQ